MSDLKTGSVQGAKGGLRTGTLDRDPQQQAARDYERAQQQAAREWSKADPREQLDMIYDAAREVIQAELNRLNIQGAKGRWPFFSVNRDPVEIPKTVQTTQPTTERVRQFAARVVEDKLEMNFGQVYGLGMVGEIPSPLVDQEFAEVGSSGSNKGVWLRIEFTPVSEPYNIFYEGEETTFYAIAGGGTDGSVTIIVQTGQPTDQIPDVDSDTGDATADGIFHVRLAQDSGGSVQNDLYGPLSVSFCPPSSIRIWESSL